MAIEFVIEDGTNKTDATSYVTVADFRQYWENRGVDYATYADSQCQVALNKATQYIDNLYLYQGQKETVTQSLEFPRDCLYDRNYIDQSSTIPDRLQYAVCECAGFAIEGNSFDPANANVRSKSMGKLSVTYDKVNAKNPKLIKAEKYIGDYAQGTRVSI